jgi:hypothetical protein
VLPTIDNSILVASIQIILFVEMLRFLKNVFFFKRKNVVKENNESFKAFNYLTWSP